MSGLLDEISYLFDITVRLHQKTASDVDIAKGRDFASSVQRQARFESRESVQFLASQVVEDFTSNAKSYVGG